MANNFNASFATIRAREQQEQFLKRSVAVEAMADTSYDSTLTRGRVLTRTYRSTSANDVPDVYVRGTDMTPRDVTDTDETLTVNREFAISIKVDDFDKLQNNYDAAVNYGKDYGIILQSQVDSDVLGEVVNAYSTVDAGTLGWTAGQGITATTTNVLSIITACTRKLALTNVYDTNRFGIVSPEMEEIISLYYGAKVTDLWDRVSENGRFKTISGYELYSSNNTTGSAVLSLATNPTAGETVTINGAVFTFVSSIGTTAGNVLIGANVDATRANLANLINAPTTTTATGVALPSANAKVFLARITATDNATADTLTVVAKWVSTLRVSETLSAVADVWTPALQKQLLVFGVKNSCTTLVMQKRPSIEVNQIPLQFGKYINNGMLYGIKTFSDNAKNMVKVEINSSTF